MYCCIVCMCVCIYIERERESHCPLLVCELQDVVLVFLVLATK